VGGRGRDRGRRGGRERMCECERGGGRERKRGGLDKDGVERE
jgi:hypothetical protein